VSWSTNARKLANKKSNFFANTKQIYVKKALASEAEAPGGGGVTV
jgi:ribonucleotide reductase beta subunit family protein with ferritin-like domain